MICSRCNAEHNGQSWCRQCRTVYMREWRKTHPPTEAQRVRASARAYARWYRKHGWIKPQPCWCGSTNVEMHHPDYSKPKAVVFLCRPHHLELHAEKK